MRLLPCAVTILLILSLCSPIAEAQSRRHRTKRELQSSLSALRQRKQRLAAELKRTTRRATAVVGDIQIVDGKIEQTEKELSHTETRLTGSVEEQKELRKRLAQATTQLDLTRQQVRQRLANIYMQGPNSFLTAMVGTKSVGDIASRTTVMEMIASKDREVFERYKSLRGEVADEKGRQDRLVVRIRSLKNDQEHQADQLKDLRSDKKEVLAGLRERQGELRALIAKYEADESNIAAQIAAYRERVRRGQAGPPLPAFTGRFVRPINARITSGFGMRYHPILHYRRLHAGIDFGAPIGTRVVAAAAGRVVATGYGSGFGTRVIIDHGGGLMTVYAHLSRVTCEPGQLVRQGQQIAASGNSGMSTGPHLHFEVRMNNNPVNPLGRL